MCVCRTAYTDSPYVCVSTLIFKYVCLRIHTPRIHTLTHTLRCPIKFTNISLCFFTRLLCSSHFVMFYSAFFIVVVIAAAAATTVFAAANDVLNLFFLSLYVCFLIEYRSLFPSQFLSFTHTHAFALVHSIISFHFISW